MDDYPRIIAALVARNGCGRCRLSPHELAQAPAERLRISTDQRGDLWLDFVEHDAGPFKDEDTWPIED